MLVHRDCLLRQSAEVFSDFTEEEIKNFYANIPKLYNGINPLRKKLNEE